MYTDFGIPDYSIQHIDGAVHFTCSETNPACVENLLDTHGVSAHTIHNGNLGSLVNELAHGHQVVLGADASGIWSGASFSGIDQLTTGVDGIVWTKNGFE